MALYDETETEEKSWQDFANCLGVDPDLFFPERGAS
ncbi:MAG: WhiB family transcriptional regulator, partial [Actinobacteria bacterium]|nr:WhiB family transcriptional regulator [Actinomycetota bacterium]NDH76010.1 WhiB family transcriptional regulator [Actinomycetota bacterium]